MRVGMVVVWAGAGASRELGLAEMFGGNGGRQACCRVNPGLCHGFGCGVIQVIRKQRCFWRLRCRASLNTLILLALVDIAEGAEVRRYNVPIGYALAPIAAGSWVHERLLRMPAARELEGLAMATVKPEPQPALEGYTFEGFRNLDGSVGTRNILASTQTVQCVAVQRIKAELLPKFPNVDDVVALEHSYGCGVAIDAPGAEIPIRTLRNISLNPNFGGELMVVSLGCKKLQPERLLPPGTFAIIDERNVADVGTSAEAPLDVVCLQDEAHVGFMSMVESIMRQAGEHLERLNASAKLFPPVSWWSACSAAAATLFFRRHRPSGGRLLHRLAGARRRQRDVFRDHRSARRHRSADLARRHAGSGRGDGPRDGLERRLSDARQRRPKRQYHAGQ